MDIEQKPREKKPYSAPLVRTIVILPGEHVLGNCHTSVAGAETPCEMTSCQSPT